MTDQTMTMYMISFGDDGYSEDIRTVSAPSADEAIEGLAAELLDWLRQEYDPQDETYWVDGAVVAVPLDANGDEDEESVDRAHEGVTLQVDPTEPPCEDDAHDWQSPIELVGGIKENPGVWGHGGGVVISEVCIRCGCGRTTDTWASNGAIQGLTSVAYEVGAYDLGELAV